MTYEQYRFKFYLNASHAIYIHGTRGQTHPHTWEITIDTMKMQNDFIQFDTVENAVEQYLSKFQDTNLNDQPAFQALNPTLENICEFFCKSIREILNNNGWMLLQIELGETPARSYIMNMADDGSLRGQYDFFQKKSGGQPEQP